MKKKKVAVLCLLILVGVGIAFAAQNLILHYPINEGSGNTITDKTGTIVLTNASGQAWTSGSHQQNAAEFPIGSSNSAATSLNDFNPSVTSPFSVELTYRYPTSSSCSIGVIPTGFLDVLGGTMNYYSNGRQRGWNINSDLRDGFITLMVSSDNGDRGGFHFAPPANEICDHHWHTIRMIWGGDASGSGSRAFWDGVEQTALTEPWSNLNNGDNVVGNGYFFIGNDPTNASPNPVDVEKFILSTPKCTCL